ncbi:MAG: hypothetical protein OEX08_00745 [Candidatus Nomurabacteria bacterium]|nr:hypothetical protein [Candidatus Nomurabacteria bacterium]
MHLFKLLNEFFTITKMFIDGETLSREGKTLSAQCNVSRLKVGINLKVKGVPQEYMKIILGRVALELLISLVKEKKSTVKFVDEIGLRDIITEQRGYIPTNSLLSVPFLDRDFELSVTFLTTPCARVLSKKQGVRVPFSYRYKQNGIEKGGKFYLAVGYTKWKLGKIKFFEKK